MADFAVEGEKARQVERKKRQQLRPLDATGAFLCGAGSGVLTKLVDFPMDTIKTRMQLEPDLKSVSHCAAHIRKTEGIPGFYAGLPAPVVSYALCSAVAFAAFGAGTSMYDAARQKVTGAPSSSDFSTARVLFGGAVSGVGKAAVTTPQELVKCKMQAEPSRWRNVLHCGAETWREGGPRALLCGHASNTLREVSGTSVWFALFEAGMTWAADDGPRSSVGVGTSCAISGSSGIVYWVIATPFDTVKTRMQVDGDVHGTRRVVPGLMRIASREGTRALYMGFSASVYRTVPGSAILLTTYNMLAERWRKRAV